MKNNLKKVTQKMLDKFPHLTTSDSVREFSLYFSVYFAILSISEDLEKDNNVALNLIRLQFPGLYERYLTFLQKLEKKELNEINLEIKSLHGSIQDDSNILSWMYQYLKKNIEKSAFNKTGINKNKISGDDILFTTQFFTDEYMVRYLVDTVFQYKEKDIDKTIFVDPAVGGGNFLTYAFDKYFSFYKKTTNWSEHEIGEYILEQKLFAYDLDPYLVQIAELSLYMHAFHICKFQTKISLNIFHGIPGDTYGTLANHIQSNLIANKSFQKILQTAYEENRHVLFVTNPPFMGKRDMDVVLKRYILDHFPESKGDLCVSFIQKLMRCCNENSLIATVSQNNWLKLKSFKAFREILLTEFFLYECADLGSKAFADINGEKANITLSVIGRKKLQLQSKFFNLKNCNRPDKESLLLNNDMQPIFIDSKKFLDNPNYEFNFENVALFDNLRTLPKYGQFAKCMQGTSTGNNKDFVKFIWEKVDKPDDWRMVSKGGGYSKWNGLNYYKVKWGKDAFLIKQNQGSALRNINLIPETQLVYSDTGTLGLNVRLLKKNQVFIASGPGILVTEGKPICHMAFLNSKIVTFIIRTINPKFSLSAGYISSIPVPDNILSSEKIERLAKSCIKKKTEYLSTKLPDSEYRHLDFAKLKDIDLYIRDMIKQDIVNDNERYQLERKIDCEIIEQYGFNDNEVKIIMKETGFMSDFESIEEIDLDTIDRLFAKSINLNCMFVPKKLDSLNVGGESLIEYMSSHLRCNPKVLYRIMLDNIGSFKKTIQLYRNDLEHKILLSVIDKCLQNQHTISLDELNVLLSWKLKCYKECNFSTEKIKMILTNHHPKSFFTKPYITLTDNIITIEKGK